MRAISRNLSASASSTVTTCQSGQRTRTRSATSTRRRRAIETLLLLGLWGAAGAGCSRTPTPTSSTAPIDDPALLAPAEGASKLVESAEKPVAVRNEATPTDAAQQMTQQWLQFDGDHEMWLRSSPLKTGEPAEFQALWTNHATGDALPVTRMTVLPSCGKKRSIRAKETATPGRFRWQFTPEPGCALVVRAFTAAGASSVRVTLAQSTPIASRVGFSMSKTTQWETNVRTAPVSERWLRRATRAAVTVEAGQGAETVFTAPAAGRIGRPIGPWPRAHVQSPAGRELLTLALTVSRTRRGLPSAWLPQNQARRDLDSAVSSLVLHAPHIGTVARVMVHPGQRVTKGAPVLVIVDDRDLALRVSMSPAERLQLGAKPQLLLLPDREAVVAVSMAQMRRDPEQPGHILIPLRSPRRRWRVGERVPAAIEGGKPANRVAVPAAAVLRAGAETYVFVQRAGARFERRVVTLAFWSGDAWAVSSGVIKGERVVVGGIDAVRQAQSNERARKP